MQKGRFIQHTPFVFFSFIFFSLTLFTFKEYWDTVYCVQMNQDKGLLSLPQQRNSNKMNLKVQFERKYNRKNQCCRQTLREREREREAIHAVHILQWPMILLSFHYTDSEYCLSPDEPHMNCAGVCWGMSEIECVYVLTSVEVLHLRHMCSYFKTQAMSTQMTKT